METYLSMATITVDQMLPFREIWRPGQYSCQQHLHCLLDDTFTLLHNLHIYWRPWLYFWYRIASDHRGLHDHEWFVFLFITRMVCFVVYNSYCTCCWNYSLPKSYKLHFINPMKTNGKHHHLQKDIWRYIEVNRFKFNPFLWPIRISMVYGSIRLS